MKSKAITLTTIFFLTMIGSALAESAGKKMPDPHSSVILKVEGIACMGQDRSRVQTQHEAKAMAKRKAAEDVQTYIDSETQLEDGLLKSDLVSAYAQAKVRIIDESPEGWFKQATGVGASDECFKISIKAEVIPDPQIAKKASQKNEFWDDPRSPLAVRLWTEKDEYRSGDRVKIYVRGNKPFYGLIVYKDATGNLIQLLPNPYRNDNYFQGGVVYELPGGSDRYDLEIQAPFGRETLTLYASTATLGSLKLTPTGPVFAVQDEAGKVEAKTRGIKFVEKTKDSKPTATKAEFAETSTAVTTQK